MPEPNRKLKRSRRGSERPSAETDSAFAPQTNTEDLLQLFRTNPSSLNSSQILQLQRTLGNAAVSRMAAQARNRPIPQITQANSESVGRTIQRLIGFEIETRIPLHYKYQGDYYNPDYDEIHADVGTGDNSEFGVDKEGKTPIAEFVSGPVDDSQVSKNFKRQAALWVSKIKKLHTDAAATPPTKKLSESTGSDPTLKGTADELKPKHVHFGFAPGQSQGDKDKVAIQVTHGLRLDQVANYMAKFKMANKFSGRLQAKEESLHEVGPLMDTLMQSAAGHVDPATLIAKKSDRKQALAEVRGFFSLLSQYLVMGSKGTKSFLKNQPTLFYKSKMSNVCANLIGSNAYAAALLNDTNRAWTASELLKVTGRDGGSSLLTGSVVTVSEWLDEVFTCTDDSLFEEAKNPWGKDIAPGDVKGGLAVVLEHRDLVNEVLPDNDMNLQNPNKIVDYMLKIFKANKKIQGLHHG